MGLARGHSFKVTAGAASVTTLDLVGDASRTEVNSAVRTLKGFLKHVVANGADEQIVKISKYLLFQDG